MQDGHHVIQRGHSNVQERPGLALQDVREIRQIEV
jgi:hypothetical protein